MVRGSPRLGWLYAYVIMCYFLLRLMSICIGYCVGFMIGFFLLNVGYMNGILLVYDVLLLWILFMV